MRVSSTSSPVRSRPMGLTLPMATSWASRSMTSLMIYTSDSGQVEGRSRHRQAWSRVIDIDSPPGESFRFQDRLPQRLGAI